MLILYGRLMETLKHRIDAGWDEKHIKIGLNKWAYGKPGTDIKTGCRREATEWEATGWEATGWEATAAMAGNSGFLCDSGFFCGVSAFDGNDSARIYPESSFGIGGVSL